MNVFWNFVLTWFDGGLVSCAFCVFTVSLHMSGEKKGKERVRDANRRFRLSSSSLSVLIIKSNFVTPCQVGIKKKKERKENMREVDNEVSSRFFKWGFHYSFHT
jgi:hypothetical protein